MSVFSIVRQLVAGSRRLLLLAIAATAVSSFLAASSVVSLAPIIDLLIHPDFSAVSGLTASLIRLMTLLGLPVSFLTVAGLFLAVVALKNIVQGIARFIMTKLHFRLIQTMIMEEFSTLLSSSWSFFVSKNYGMVGNTIVKETEKVGLAFEALTEILAKSLEVAFYLLLTFFISPTLTLFVLALVGLGVIPFAFLGRLTFRAGHTHTKTANAFQGIILETLNAAKLVVGFGNQYAAIERLREIIPKHVGAAMKFVMIRAATPLGFEPIGMAIMLGAVALGFYRYGLGVSELFVMLYALRMCAQRALEVVDQKNSFQHMIPALEQIYKLKEEAIAARERAGDIAFTGLVRELRLHRLSFSYPNHVPVLRDITLVVPKGKTIAIVGKSGSGKTTLLDILLGFYDVGEQEYLVDGVAFVKLDRASWRKRLGYVPQEPFLFNLSIRDNLLWSNPAASDEQLVEACERAHAREFIEALPNRYETVVGERGVMLSGGQRQRLALARAILRRPEVLVLDEATSSLDSESERLIQHSLEQLAGKTTMIVVAHRLSTIRKADYIYVIDEGRLVEEGTFEQLIERGGAFLKAAQLQGISGNNALQEKAETVE